MRKNLVLTFSFCFFMPLLLSAQSKVAFLQDYNKKWVDSVFNSMTLDEKIGQLMMPRGNYSGKPHDVEKLAGYVRDYKVGGIVFFAAPPSVQARLTNYLQSISKTPLFIGEDFEWGLAMRMDSTDRFPYNMTLGAIEGEQYLEEMGKEIGRQCKRLGVHINYAPVVDVNVNINNPVINFRSIGEDKIKVTNKALAIMKGMQSQNLIATAKHFPGHGDTDVDSHKDLPVINHDKKRLQEIELFPFQTLIDNGVAGIMTSHLDIPVLNNNSGLAATFSKKVLSELLRDEMGFTGLTFTDAMDMKGAVKNFPDGEAMVMALLAGNDVLETFEDVPVAFNAIKNAIKKGKLPMALLEEKVKKILKAKSWVGLDHYTPIILEGLVKDLNTSNSDFLNRQFAETSVTLLKNKNDILPINDLNKKIALVTSDGSLNPGLYNMCKKYTNIDYFNIPANDSTVIYDLLPVLKEYETIITALQLKEIRPSLKYSLNRHNTRVIELLAELPNNILCILGNVIAIPQIKGFEKYDAIIAAYQNTRYTETALAQMIFGGLPFKGKLPITLNENFRAGHGIKTIANRMSYGIPEQVGLDGKELKRKIDSIVYTGIKNKAYPGCVVQIVKDGRTVFEKAYGFHRYEDANQYGYDVNEEEYESGNKSDAMDYFEQISYSTQKIKTEKNVKGKTKPTDLFDLASITKISTSALALMQLSSDGKFNINHTFSHYSDEMKSGNKADLIFKDMLTHRAGLKAWIPFWRNCIDTLATVNLALQNNPALSDQFQFKITKPSFFKRIFCKKPKKEILILPSIQANESLFTQCLTSKNLIWKKGIFESRQTGDFRIKINEDLYLNEKYMNTIIEEIKNSPVNKSQGYVYSDLHYYLYPTIIKRITGVSMENYLYKTYGEIGAHTLTYNPLEKFKPEQIVPTEMDSLFRKKLIHGYVHDEGAAMMNGISGHAGLFGNANDLSKLMLLYLNKGRYGNKEFFKSSIIDEFTSYQFKEEKNRRGIAFDKADFDPTVMNAPKLASTAAYGHSGFTGTFTWIEPEHNFLYVFLSNRVYPTRDNKKISELNIRTAIGDVIYELIGKK